MSLTVQESDITTDSVYKCFPAVDLAAMGFRVVFQVTDSGSHLIQLSAIKEICQPACTHYVRRICKGYLCCSLWYQKRSSKLVETDSTPSPSYSKRKRLSAREKEAQQRPVRRWK